MGKWQLAFACCWAVSLAVTAWGAPEVFPAPNATQVPPDAPLRIKLPAPATLGTGKVEVCSAADNTVAASIDVSQPTREQSIGGLANYLVRPVLLGDGQAVIILPPHALAYGKTYYVKFPAGAITGIDWSGLSAAGEKSAWRFSTQAATPAADAQRLVVDANGTADFATIQGAIDFVPEGNKQPRTIFIRNGTYNEILCLMNRDHLTFLGQQRAKTIIAYPNNDRFNPNSGGNPFGPGMPQPGMVDPKTGAVYRRGVFLAHRVSDLTLANLTIHNTTPHGGSQAETIIFNGSPDAAHLILTNLDLLSFQDTFQLNGQAFVNDCYVEGDVDFMWGTGPCFLQNVHARAVTNGAIFTTVRCPPPPNTNHGFVFNNCTLDGAPGVTGTFLARIEANRFPTSETILLNAEISPAISPAGWRPPTGGDASSVHFWEFNSHDAAGKPINASQRIPASRQLQADADKQIIAQYGNPQFVLGGPSGGWQPALAPLIARSPTDTSSKTGSAITLEVDAVAIPAPTYQWRKDGKDLPGATTRTLHLENLAPQDAGQYTVTLTNAAGTATSTPARLALAP